MYVNVLAYADDIVLCSPSWRALQLLINILVKHAASIQLQVNVNKTVCMMFLQDRTKIISKTFPPFMLEWKELKFVTDRAVELTR